MTEAKAKLMWGATTLAWVSVVFGSISTLQATADTRRMWSLFTLAMFAVAVHLLRRTLRRQGVI